MFGIAREVRVEGPDAIWGAETIGIPPARLPPTLGGLSWYWICSSSLTTQPIPLNRAHSASRAAVVSVPGAVKAPPIDQPSHRSGTSITTPARRNQIRRRLGRDTPGRGGWRCF